MARALWDDMCEVVKWHNEQRHCCVDTINRLLRKHPVARDRGHTPQVERRDLDVAAESWRLEELWSLVHPEQRTSDEPSEYRLPVVVLRWERVDYLIDGRRRINYWHRSGIAGPHSVLLLHQAAPSSPSTPPDLTRQ